MKAKTSKTKRERHILPPLDPQQRYSVNEAINYLRISRAHLYGIIGTGEIKVIKSGARTFIPGSEILRASAPEAA